MTSIKTIVAAALVALLVPVAAGAKDARVSGPLALAGQGYFGGELTMAMADGQRPVKIAGRGGYLGILDLRGDLRVRCLGKARVQKQRTDRGAVYSCTGRGVQAVLLGSHFMFRGFSEHYRVSLPAGVVGSFHGRFTTADEQPERRAAPAEMADDELPTLSELAAMLAGK
ncbi:MAG TPA: hypothetical protein VIE18_02810 [Gaiellaceae bacterium]|jgi:hypothetical protein